MNRWTGLRALVGLEASTIQGKLRAAIVLVCGTILITTSAVQFLLFARQDRESGAADVAILADGVASSTASAVVFDDPLFAAQELARLRSDPSIIGAWIWSERGDLFASYGRRARTEAVAVPEKPFPTTATAEWLTSSPTSRSVKELL